MSPPESRLSATLGLEYCSLAKAQDKGLKKDLKRPKSAGQRPL